MPGWSPPTCRPGRGVGRRAVTSSSKSMAALGHPMPVDCTLIGLPPKVPVKPSIPRSSLTQRAPGRRTSRRCTSARRGSPGTARPGRSRRARRGGGSAWPDGSDPGLLQELAGGVVGQDLAAGLAGGAVVHGVAAVLDRADRVAADRTGLAGRGGAPRRDGRPTSSCRRASARRPGPRRRVVDGRRRPRCAPSAPSLPVDRERRELRPVADLVGQPPARARRCVLVAQEAVQAHRVRGEQRGQLVGVDGRSASGPRRVERRAASSASPAHAPHAGPALGARPR